MTKEKIREELPREDERLAAVTRAIIDWYRDKRRPLPWRENPTPYRVWISEIMLQQTRIEAVIPYFERFLRVLPNISALAEVEEDTLLKLWEGLGYYSRARNLKRAAEKLMAEHGGVLPASAQALSALPGIGDYTAGAIASIAFGLPEPAVDGNVLRVLMRLLNCDMDVMRQNTKALAAKALRPHYPCGEGAALLTEGLMELGETVCLPKGAPRCEQCPAAEFCLAREQGRQEELPVREAKIRRKVEEHTVLILHHQGCYALQKRPETGLLASLWELPWLPGKAEKADESWVESWQEAGRFAPKSWRKAGESRHLFSHVEWKMEGIWVECGKRAGDYVWATAEEIRERYALPTAYACYVKQLK